MEHEKERGYIMNNKGLMILGTLGAILLGFIAPLIAYACKDNLQQQDRAIIASFLNFELSLLIICLVLNFVPAIGHLLSLAFWVVNIIYSLQAYTAAKTGSNFNAPSFYEFVK